MELVDTRNPAGSKRYTVEPWYTNIFIDNKIIFNLTHNFHIQGENHLVKSIVKDKVQLF